MLEPDSDLLSVFSALDLSDDSSLFREPFSERNSLQSFQNFTKFPAEIRLKIYRCCFPPPRRIDLRNLLRANVVWTVRQNRHKKPPRRCPCLTHKLSHPVTLFVNQESRQETLRHYKILHRKCPRQSAEESTYKEPMSVSVRPEIDIFYINSLYLKDNPCRNTSEFWSRNEIAQDSITSLELYDYTDFLELEEFVDVQSRKKPFEFLKKFPKLSSVRFITDRPDPVTKHLEDLAFRPPESGWNSFEPNPDYWVAVWTRDTTNVLSLRSN
jgi:hypothetical protein